jgi:alkylation response protein AidB-like acyl-CoA dehydrogenase
MGYKGVDTTEMVFKGFRVPADAVLGGKRGGGFAQMMDGVEVGRVTSEIQKTIISRGLLREYRTRP